MAAGGASWAADDAIIFQQSVTGDFWRIAGAGGQPVRLRNTFNAERGMITSRWPHLLPNGDAVLFASGDTGSLRGTPLLGVYRLGTGSREELPQTGTSPHYVPTGHLLYVQNGTLMASLFDPSRLQVTGAQTPVVTGVMQAIVNGGAHYDVSDNGVLVYLTGADQSVRRSLVWVDRNGNEQPLSAPIRPYRQPRLSPNDRQIAVTLDDPTFQTWVYDLTRETLTRLMLEANTVSNSAWTADGKRVVVGWDSPVGLFWQMSDGSVKAERLTASQYPQSPHSFSADGRFLAYREQNTTTGNDIWVLRLDDNKAEPFVQTPFNEAGANFSPDGRWITYVSNESGRDEVYVKAFPGPGGKWQISAEGGREPSWSPDGRELFFRNGNKMMVSDIAEKPEFSTGKPRLLFEGDYLLAPTSSPNYDMSSDGRRFLMVKADQSQATAPTLHVVTNWFEELNRRVPVK
jgi:serine/threonine-protein kinase